MSNPNNPKNGDPPSPKEATFYHGSVELADLGRARFDQDTAAIGDRDLALYAAQPVVAPTGRAPKGLEDQVFAWNTFKFTTAEVDSREELKGNLHGGQLHRANRAVREGVKGDGFAPLCAARKPLQRAPPMAKGSAEELDKGFFWDEEIV
ncbi:hypothetical protein BDW02DRAFT_605126 [Decorospora gaudefroyi]|uniref:Uncharacterized protein n=1 Tax=Decorospora gaudefroyi TaxID=184978 RepID=A0A6A5K7M3_9PLEO|nr:hypothetical protein BDW02DRAFT_605126 [Decorospora gaudefroyi]